MKLITGKLQNYSLQPLTTSTVIAYKAVYTHKKNIRKSPNILVTIFGYQLMFIIVTVYLLYLSVMYY